MKTRFRQTGCLLLAALLTGCTTAPQITEHRHQTAISFSWWGNDKRTDYTLEGVRQFEKLHPDIRVICSYSEWSGYEDRNRVQMMSDTESDVMQVNFGWLSKYSPDGTGYYDMEKLSGTLDLTAFSDSALEYGRRAGILNAVPIAMNTETVYYNQTVYEKYGLELPKTWDDLFAAAAVMKPDGVFPTSGAAKSIWLYLLAYAEQKSGRQILDADGKLCFTPADFQTMIEMYVRMIKESVIPQVEYYDRANLDKGVYAGTVAWVSDAVSYLSGAIKAGNVCVPGDYTAFDPAQSGKGWYAKPATLYAISKNTEHPQEAAMLLDFLLNSKEMAELQGVEKGIPLSSKAKGFLDDAGIMTGIQYEASQKMEHTEGMLKMQPFLENSGFIDAFVDACNQVLYDKSTPADAAQALWEQAKK